MLPQTAGRLKITFFACYPVSRPNNGSWSHYTVFKVLRSLPEAHFRAPLGDSLAIIPLPATNVKCFFENNFVFLSNVFHTKKPMIYWFFYHLFRFIRIFRARYI